MVLSRKIVSPINVKAWTVSSGYQQLVTFIQTALQGVLDLLGRLSDAVNLFPPEDEPQRFGNKSFRSWFAWLKENVPQLCRDMLFDKNGITTSTIPDASLDELIGEVAGYFIESFGNATRIDYGTGHELAFVAFLLCLFRTGVLQSSKVDVTASTKSISDHTAVGLVVMPAYLNLVRHLQKVYRMEPAGSHGVWCLDDFQFVPFIWGSSQLIGHDQYGPSAISDQQIAVKEKDSYLLFSCIDYIYKVKTGPFSEHSNVLYGIGQVPHWEKVNSGLIKMYKGEVLDKFPVVQHFLFGRLLTMDRSGPAAPSFRAVIPPSSATPSGELGMLPPGALTALNTVTTALPQSTPPAPSLATSGPAGETM